MPNQGIATSSETETSLYMHYSNSLKERSSNGRFQKGLEPERVSLILVSSENNHWLLPISFNDAVECIDYTIVYAIDPLRLTVCFGEERFVSNWK
jgi:hypothetical protein